MRNTRIWVSVALTFAFVLGACASREDVIRADLQDSGLSAESVDCVMDAFEGAGIDVERLQLSATDNAPTVESECLDAVFAEMFSGLTSEFADLTDGDLDWAPATEADLDRLFEACRDGDVGACDDLWLRSPVGSAHETYGATCGGRAAEPQYGSCRIALD